MPQYDKELTIAARTYIKRLEKASFTAILDSDTFREYSVKINILKANNPLGNLVIYYKPSKKSFSLRSHEINVKTYENELHAIWENHDVKTSIEIYIDGSFMSEKIGWASVILKDGEVIEELSGELLNKNLLPMRQVSGELHAAMEAVLWCRKNNIKEFSLFFDYTGIRDWAEKNWRAKNEYTQAYRDFMEKFKDIKIHWEKVAAHSGNHWNERADELAKAATKR